ncbi:MAG: tetratricopeptide repeat protein [Pseudomonadota bacterium]
MAEHAVAGEALSNREREVATAYAAGASYKEIARSLGISPQTVRTYLGIIYRKMGVSSKIALADSLAPVPAVDPSNEPYPTRPEKPSIAVLAFTNMSSDKDQEYLSDGISDDIITALSHSPWLFVIARSSTFSYKGQEIDIRQVAKELGVRFVLEGGVRRSGERVRVTARLVDGDTGGHVWTDRYDGTIDDVFDLQDEITRNVVASIQTAVHLNMAVEPVERKERPNVTVWELNMRAWRLLYSFDHDNYDAAKSLLNRALELDPKSAEAHYILSLIIRHECDLFDQDDREQNAKTAYGLAKRATVLAETNEYAHWAHGISCWMIGRHHEAADALERAVELNPNCSLAYGSLGSALAYLGRPEEAIANQEIAIRSNPRDPSIFYRYFGVALAHYVAGRYDVAIDWVERSIVRKPDWYLSHGLHAATRMALGEEGDARAAIEACRTVDPGITTKRFSLFSFQDASRTQTFMSQLRAAGLTD